MRYGPLALEEASLKQCPLDLCQRPRHVGIFGPLSFSALQRDGYGDIPSLPQAWRGYYCGAGHIHRAAQPVLHAAQRSSRDAGSKPL